METSKKWTGPLAGKNVGGLVEINGVKGYLQRGDIELLTFFALRIPSNGRILEVGSFLGLSSLIMARALHQSGNHGARIYCVDTWEGSPEHQAMEMVQNHQMFDIFMRNISESGLGSMITPVRKASVAASLDFPVRSFDMIFIDGDHSFRGCIGDLVAWYPKLRQGGIFIGHDGEKEVRRAVEVFMTEKEDLSCILLGTPPYSNFMYRLVDRKALLAQPL